MKKIASIAAVLIAVSFNGFTQSIEQGLRFLDNEQYDKALKTFEKITPAVPQDIKSTFYRGYTYSKMQKYDSALLMFDKCIQFNANDPLGYVGKGYMQVVKGVETEALSYFEKAFALGKGRNAQIFIIAAESYLDADKKNPDKAIELLNKALLLDRANTDAYILLGDAHLLKNNGGLAVTNYEKASELNKNLAKAYHRVGKVYTRSKNYTVALNSMLQAIKVDEAYIPVYQDLGELYYQLKKLDKAKEAYKKYLDLSNIKNKSRARYASFLYLSKDYANAVNELTESIKIDSSNYILLRLLGYCLYETGKYPEGLSYMTKFFRKVDSIKILSLDYEYYGRLQYKNNQDSLAVLSIRKALAKDTTKMVELHQLLADCHYKAKQYPDAVREYEFVMGRKSKILSQDYYNWGKATYFNKEYAKSDSAFAKVISLQPDMPVGYLWQGRSRASLDPETTKGLAKGSYEKVIEKAISDPVKYKNELIEAYSYFGYYFYVKKDASSSISYWQKVKDLDPTNQKAIQALKNIKVKQPSSNPQ